MRKIYVLTLPFFAASLTLSAQSFAPFNAAYRYHYQSAEADYISNTIFVDSLSLAESDSVFHLNRVVTDCDTCEVSWWWHPVLLNQPQFPGHTVIRQVDGRYRFEGRDTFWLDPQAAIGDTWIFDPAGTVEAGVATVEIEDVFGQPETVKVIGTTDSRMFYLSENYGLIRYEDPAETYDLVGIGGPDLGERLPDYFAFFDFSVGDVFQYQGWYSSFPGKPFRDDYTEKITIVGKEMSGDTLLYTMRIRRRTMHYNGFYYTSIEDYQTTLNYSYDPNHPTALFPGALMKNPLGLVGEFGVDEGEYGRVSVYRDEASGRVTKVIGGWTQEEGPTLYPLFMPDEQQPGLGLPCCADEFYARYQEGLGLLDLHLFYFEVNEDRWLEGYVQGGDTTGVITPDSLLLLSAREVEMVQRPLTVFPNPAGETLWVELPEAATGEVWVRLFDSQGRLVREEQRHGLPGRLEVDVSLLPPGIYLAEAWTETGRYQARWVRR